MVRTEGASAAATVDRRAPLAALTGLRFLAAMHVVAYHFAQPALPPETPRGIRHAIGHGYVGVSFFYLLSGFILAYNYAVRDTDSRTTMRGSHRRFWWNRFARVYPLYLVAWLLAAPGVIAHRLAADGYGLACFGKTAVAALTSLFLVQAWVPGAHAWWNPPGWSISVEAFFYAVFPFLLPRLGAMTSNFRSASLLLWVAAVTAPIVFVVGGSPAMVLAIAKYDPILHLPTFVFGTLLAGLLDSRHRETLKRLRGGLAVLGVLALALALRLPSGPYDLLFHNGLLIPAFAAIILSVALGVPLLAPVLASAPLIALGEASFGIYILQAPLHVMWDRLDLPVGPAADVALYMAALMTASLIAFRIIESPAQQWLRRWSANASAP